jgi:hypothetical protein
VQKSAFDTTGGVHRQEVFLRASFSLILRGKINENDALRKFYSDTEGGRIPFGQPHSKRCFAAEGIMRQDGLLVPPQRQRKNF